MNIKEQLEAIFRERIVVMDGAMGTMIQAQQLGEEDFRGERFADHPVDLKGCNDLLAVTQPALIEKIHRQYFDAGADIVETNTFNATSISLADYGLQDHAFAGDDRSGANLFGLLGDPVHEGVVVCRVVVEDHQTLGPR